MKHLKGQQCLFTKICIETEVSWKSRVVNKNLQIFDVFAVFQDELEARITLKRLLFTTNIRSKYSKYSSERFFFQLRSENVERLFKFYTRSDHCLKSYKCASSDGINNARLHEHETRKKKIQMQYNLKLTGRDVARESHEVRPESLKIFQPSYASSKAKY